MIGKQITTKRNTFSHPKPAYGECPLINIQNLLVMPIHSQLKAATERTTQWKFETITIDQS